MNLMAYIYFLIQGDTLDRVETINDERKRRVEAGNAWVKEFVDAAASGSWLRGSLEGVAFPEGHKPGREWKHWCNVDGYDHFRPHRAYKRSKEFEKKAREFTQPAYLDAVKGMLGDAARTVMEPVPGSSSSYMREVQIVRADGTWVLALPKSDENEKWAPPKDLQPIATSEFVAMVEKDEAAKAV